jgi:hypothetical protein
MELNNTIENNNVKLGYNINSYYLEISHDNFDLFSKLIKNSTKYCKKLQLPLPQVISHDEKKYYILGNTKFDSTINYLHDTITDNKEEIIQKHKKFNDDFLAKIKNTEKLTYLSSIYSIYSTTVQPFTINIVDKIKPNNEWIILGVIDHINTIVKAAPEQFIPTELIPSDLHSNSCDHCKIERVRNKTVYIKNLNNSEIKRVGGSCIKYYLGYNYGTILEYLNNLSLFMNYKSNNDYGFNDENHGNHGHYLGEELNIKDCVKYFSWYVKKHGYISKKAVQTILLENPEKNIEPTSSSVNSFINWISKPPYNKDLYEQWLNDCIIFNTAIESENEDFYNELVQFIKDNYQDNNFLYNSYNFIQSGLITTNNLNYLIGACSMLQGKKTYIASLIKTNESNFIGIIGEKIKLENLTIKNINGFESAYGYVNIYTLIDDKDNIFVKFGKLDNKFLVDGNDVQIGSKVSFITEIKEHKDYNGKKQTILGRFSKIKK